MKLRFNSIYSEYDVWDSHDECEVIKRYYHAKNQLEYFDEETQEWIVVPSVESVIVREGKG